MRYIQKKDAPDFFMNATRNKQKWNGYLRANKKELKKYILEKEQNYLCIYCESKINIDSSHVEHIKPQSRYESLIFDYNNIVVSCEGNCHNTNNSRTKHHCGHRKGNSFDEIKFLNPIETIDMREYFKYNSNGKICFSNKNINRSKYMIDTLHLNDSQLPQARKKALRNFREKINKLPIQTKKETMRQVFKNENIAFISCLIFKYKKNIEAK